MSSPWKTVCFDNYFEDADRTYENSERWDIAKEVGFDTFWHSINFKMPERVERMRAIPEERKRSGLEASAYTVIDIRNPFPEGPNVFELMEYLRAGDTLEVGLTMDWMQDLSDPQFDAQACTVLEKLLEHADRHGLMLSLYHHYGFWMQDIEDCVRLAKRVDHERLKVTFCASHWYCRHYDRQEQMLEQAISLCQPWLHAVNLCGSQPLREGQEFPLPTTIEPVGRGTFDAAAFFKLLKAHNFQGAVGFQGFGIKGDPRENLAESMMAYQNYV